MMDVESWVVGGWSGALRVALVGVLAYVALVALLRASGKRTLSKMNSFDLIVTVAIGSTLASILTSKGLALTSGIVALAVLVGLQLLVAWLASRSSLVSRTVKSQPALLLYRGELLYDAMKRERVADDEVRAAVRQHGAPSLEVVEAVVLESDGSMTVIPKPERGTATILAGVRGAEPQHGRREGRRSARSEPIADAIEARRT